MAESVPKSVLAAVFPTMIRLPVRVISEGVSSLTLAMLKVKVLSKVFKFVDAGDTFTYILVNNNAAYFAISGNTLKLAKTVDYETRRCFQQ
jgi:hypothetical protein